MATVGHVVVGVAAGLVTTPPAGLSRGAWCGTLAAVSLLPDADVAAFALGIPYAHPFGHRGASHAALAPALLGLVVAVATRRAWPLVLALVYASHGLLDTLTDGGLGAALLWPFSDARFFAPWRPIPVAPIGPRLLGPRGLMLMARETLLFLPLLLVAAAGAGLHVPGRDRRRDP